MMNQFKRPGRIGRAIGAVTLLAAAFILTQPKMVAAQQQVTGSGTAGNIPKFTGSTPSSTVGNSIITELNGNVGISATSPNSRLSINPGVPEAKITLWDGGSPNASYHYGFGISGGQLNYHVLDSSSSHVFYQGGKNGDGIPLMIIRGSGNVGIGTTTPNERLTLAGSVSFTDRGGNVHGDIHLSNSNAAVRIFSSSTLTGTPDGAAIQFFGNTSGFPGQAYIDSGANNSAAIILRTAQTSESITERMRVTAAGFVGIGTTAPSTNLHVVGDVALTGSGNITNSGNITATGTISGGNVIAKYQDVAEWVPARNAMSAGTVVTLDPEHSNLVVASSHSYDTRVAGVVSEKPGVILGEGGEGKVMVATTGRVRVKVDATNGPIRVGDLLVTSDKEGIAMRSQPLDLGGTPIHRPGTLIGKALDPLEKGVGEILVLLSLQ